MDFLWWIYVTMFWVMFRDIKRWVLYRKFSFRYWAYRRPIGKNYTWFINRFLNVLMMLIFTQNESFFNRKIRSLCYIADLSLRILLFNLVTVVILAGFVLVVQMILMLILNSENDQVTIFFKKKCVPFLFAKKNTNVKKVYFFFCKML